MLDRLELAFGASAESRDEGNWHVCAQLQHQRADQNRRHVLPEIGVDGRETGVDRKGLPRLYTRSFAGLLCAKCRLQIGQCGGDGGGIGG